MEQPEQCPIAIHDMMLRTWDTDPTNRPTFLELMDELGDHLGTFSNKIFFKNSMLYTLNMGKNQLKSVFYKNILDKINSSKNVQKLPR